MSITCSLLLAGAVAMAVVVADHGTWDPWIFGVLLVAVLGADLLEMEVTRGFQVSGNLLGLVIAMALLGPAQATVMALISIVVWAVREPPRLAAGVMSAAAFAWFPLAGGLVMEVVGDALSAEPRDFAFVLATLAGFFVAHIVNNAIILTGAHVLDGMSVGQKISSFLVTLLPSELAMALLASVVIYAQAHLGVLALSMLAAIFFLYLYLYRELLLSKARGEELAQRTEQLAGLQVGVLTAMLRTLSMRDRMTARHSAAVARYAREIAAAYGCSKEEQDLVHTAGLLHDIGKFILPDHILVADTKLSDDDWRLIKMHPYQGAKVVREMEGYGPVADIILCHHERIDGKGYPRGVSGDDIPIYSRMISIADTYDVMTSRDSYRDPVSSDAAIAELRRVSGQQLDRELVEIFVQVLESKGVAFRHADDADFEAELQFERRMREHAAPRALVAAA